MTKKTPSLSEEVTEDIRFNDLLTMTEPNEVDMQIQSINDLATEIAEYLDEMITEVTRAANEHEISREDERQAKGWISLAQHSLQTGLMFLRRAIERPRQF